MQEFLISLIPVISSVVGSVIISKTSTIKIGKIHRTNDDKVELVKKQNKALKEENAELKEQLEKNELYFKDCLIKINDTLVSITNDVQATKEERAEMKNLVNQATIIRNELRTLLQAKKE